MTIDTIRLDNDNVWLVINANGNYILGVAYAGAIDSPAGKLARLTAEMHGFSLYALRGHGTRDEQTLHGPGLLLDGKVLFRNGRLAEG